MKNLSIQEKIVESLIEIYKDSTIHSIPRVLKSKRTSMKILWTVCFLISTSYCSYLLINSINNYFKFEHATSVDIYYEIPTRFPYVQFCNLNVFQTEKAVGFLNDFFQDYNKIASQLKETALYFFLMNRISLSNDSFKKSLSYSLDEILINCEFNTDKCNSSDFKRVYDPYYGNCYRFNSGQDSNDVSRELLYSSKSGFKYGFRLELFAGVLEYSHNLIKDNGYVVMIRNQSVNPIFGNDLIFISPGTSSYIAIDRHYDYRLGTPYNYCQSDFDSSGSFNSDLVKLFMDFNLTYDQINCFDLCFQKTLLKSCNCSFNLFNSNDVICSTSDEILCSVNERNTFLKSNIFARCSPDCPAKCDSISYSKSISASEFPSKAYFKSTLLHHPVIESKFSNQSITYENVKSNVLALNVYYEELKYTVTSQHPKITVVDLVSNIGGLLGLFVGMSFLSIVEIVEGLFEIILIVLTSRKSILKHENLELVNLN